jgi:hypothetical protein
MIEYYQHESPISRGNYGDLRIRAANLLRNSENTVIAVEQQIAREAIKVLRKGCRPRSEHAEDIALQVMSDVIKKASDERRREYATANGEEFIP